MAEEVGPDSIVDAVVAAVPAPDIQLDRDTA
jgi:hypothetical protein